MGEADELGEQRRVEDGGDEEDGVGAVDAGLVQLVVVEQEVLAQEGRPVRQGGANRGEVRQQRPGRLLASVRTGSAAAPAPT
jgi:hypothetical protein